MIGFVVEDNALGHIATEVSKQLGVTIPKRNVRDMKGDRLAKAARYARDLVLQGCERVIVLKDSIGAPPNVHQRFQNEDYPINSHLVLAIGEAESWFLADEEALSEYLRSRVNPTSKPESLADPKERLKDIFRRARGESYIETGRDPQELAQRIRPQVVAERCPSFKSFMEIIQQ